MDFKDGTVLQLGLAQFTFPGPTTCKLSTGTEREKTFGLQEALTGFVREGNSWSVEFRLATLEASP